MKNEHEVMLAWKIWHLISRLNDLIWDADTFNEGPFAISLVSIPYCLSCHIHH